MGFWYPCLHVRITCSFDCIGRLLTQYPSLVCTSTSHHGSNHQPALPRCAIPCTSKTLSRVCFRHIPPFPQHHHFSKKFPCSFFVFIKLFVDRAAVVYSVIDNIFYTYPMFCYLSKGIQPFLYSPLYTIFF